MVRRVLGLLALALVAFVLAAAFVNPTTPPGGVAWPYFAVLLLIPYATYCFATRVSVAICYGFACGLLFAWPVFVDSRTPLRFRFGVETEAELLAKITLFAIVVSALCAASYGLAPRRGQQGAVVEPLPGK